MPHRTHCCVYHGCKYGDKDCPVVNMEIEQAYPCEDCSETGSNVSGYGYEHSIILLIRGVIEKTPVDDVKALALLTNLEMDVLQLLRHGNGIT